MNNEQYAVINATKYVILPDGRMARLLKPVKVSKYNYYTYRLMPGNMYLDIPRFKWRESYLGPR